MDSIVNENNVRFSQAYSIRTMAMRDLYKKLIQAEHNLKVYINPHRPSKNKLAELEVKFRESNSEFYDYFKENEILFDSDVCGLIEDIQMIFINSVIEMEDIDRSATVISKEDRVRNWEKYNEDFEKVIPEIKVKLKTSFRAELGIK
ncbi:hypothetical protein [Roseivirga sp.]|uniref:hypothetical protein n=1 Tax=Roseivirga sp. TaxID=1964215 RepID=UPI003B52E30F